MSNDAGNVKLIIARNCRPSGNVASHLLLANAKPIRADVAITNELHVIMSAWQIASRTMFLFIAPLRDHATLV
jgi:hypothetical protein